jgi:hypothetical protein
MNLNKFSVCRFIKHQNRSYTRKQEIKWIPYSKIKNLRKIAEGGFSIVYKVTLSGSSNFDVAIKKLHGTQNIRKCFLH